MHTGHLKRGLLMVAGLASNYSSFKTESMLTLTVVIKTDLTT